MNCLYCRELNSDEEHRCRRCGRRLHFAAPPIGAAPQQQQYARTALAEQPDVQTRPRERARAVPPAPQALPGRGVARRQGPSYQPTLFGTRDMGQVLPFNAFVPTERVRPRARRPRPPRPVSTNQQSLFPAAVAAPAPARPMHEGVIYCNARVATLEHRGLAALIDFTVVALALGAFAGTLYSFGGEVLLNKQSTPVYILAAAILVILYRLLWCLGNGDSPGMRAMQLRLVDLDGHRADRRKRFWRLLSGWLSFLAAGLGLLWAVADEESLTWHDHISGTFPTSRG